MRQERAKSFHPTPLQVEFRQHARKLYDEGRRMTADWCRATAEEGWAMSVNILLWRSWEDDQGFLGWWAEMFPETSGLTVADSRNMAYRFWDSLGKGLDKGEAGALNAYTRLLAAREIASAAADPELAAWLDGKRGAAWAEVVGDAK